MAGFFSKLFGGNKSEKDVEKIRPLVAKTNEYFAAYQQLTNDELRAKSVEFRSRIQEHVKDINAEIATRKGEAETLTAEQLQEKDAIYKDVDKLITQRDKVLEDALNEIMPEAFAVIKETARRFSTQPEITATATELDKNLSVRKEYVTINGGQSVFKNTWTAGGGQITWNMVHYDVQLIGGAVLHSGKIAEMATGEGKTLVIHVARIPERPGR